MARLLLMHILCLVALLLCAAPVPSAAQGFIAGAETLWRDFAKGGTVEKDLPNLWRKALTTLENWGIDATVYVVCQASASPEACDDCASYTKSEFEKVRGQLSSRLSVFNFYVDKQQCYAQIQALETQAAPPMGAGLRAAPSMGGSFAFVMAGALIYAALMLIF